MIKYSDIFPERKVPVFSESEKEYYAEKVVLVTGGGGSVGSELVRCLSETKAKQIIIFDIYENTAFELYLEMCDLCAETKIEIEIGSVTDKKCLDSLFKKYKPDIVFHAAAHKHVFLMENNCAQAVINNCLGTLNCIVFAEKYGVEKFVLVSTDKAVRPTGVMGASKRICEMLVLSQKSRKTNFCAVRFGNVFGSHGSVIRIFQKQIESGMNVTVTDKRMTRYFISIDEAAQLLLCAGSIANNGELFVLDMGKPVKIYDLAEKMICFFGKRPNVDIKIVETGIKPGEKLYEEYLLDNCNNYTKTANDRIYIERNAENTVEKTRQIIKILSDLLINSESNPDNDAIKAALCKIIPDYKPSC